VLLPRSEAAMLLVLNSFWLMLLALFGVVV
jgi:hypothetical protein